jgi:antitoxin MazE
MQTKIAKWGNSLGVRIPRMLAASVGIEENTPVEVSAQQESIVVKPVKHKCSLRELTAKITPDNRHEETDWGQATGKEA